METTYCPMPDCTLPASIQLKGTRLCRVHGQTREGYLDFLTYTTGVEEDVFDALVAKEEARSTGR